MGGSVPELMDKMEALKREMDEINGKILACDKRFMNNKTLAVYVRNYEENKRFGLGYRRAKNQDQYYRINESRIILFEAAERNIRQLGIDPESVTYSMVMDRIAGLESEKGSLDQEYGQKAREYREMEKQMGVMKEYMEKQGIQIKETAKSEKKKGEQER